MEDIRELIEFAQKEWPDLFQGKQFKWPDQAAPKPRRIPYPAPKMKTVFDLDKEP